MIRIGEYAFYGCDNLKYNEYDNALYLGNKNNSYVALIKAKNVDITSCSINVQTKIIYPSAFGDCRGLTSITIPDNVTNIGNGAFYGCSGLTSVTIGNGVVSIGDCAFYDCSGLTSITIPDSVIYIGSLAFYNCRSLTIVTIPDGVINIEKSAFGFCENLKTINYKGSKTQWEFISKGYDWNHNTGSYTIYCTDGTISK